MSAPVNMETAAVGGLGFVITVIKAIIEFGPSVEAVYLGMLGAFGALLAKEIFDYVKTKVKQHKQNGIIRKRKSGESGV